MRTRSLVPTLAVAALTACSAVGAAWEYLTTERPPYPLRALEVTSDARIDSAGVLVGSYIGSGTNAAVHLLSSDTALIAALARVRPDLAREPDLWGALARRGAVMIPTGRSLTGGAAVRVAQARVASAYGHSNVSLASIELRGSRCGWRGAQADLLLSGPLVGSRAPSLRGPIVGSLRDDTPADARDWRDPPPEPGPGLTNALLERTAADMDSMLALRLRRAALPLTPLGAPTLDPLEDIDAAEVIPVWAGQGRVRYAVALRARRQAASGETLLAATVMVWDSLGAWRQSVFAPTVLELRRGQLRPYDDALVPVYWRRLDAVGGFGMDRDYLWLEQVGVDDGSVLWGAIEARTNGVVGAVEVGGACVG